MVTRKTILLLLVCCCCLAQAAHFEKPKSSITAVAGYKPPKSWGGPPPPISAGKSIGGGGGPSFYPPPKPCCPSPHLPPSGKTWNTGYPFPRPPPPIMPPPKSWGSGSGGYFPMKPSGGYYPGKSWGGGGGSGDYFPSKPWGGGGHYPSRPFPGKFSGGLLGGKIRLKPITVYALEIKSPFGKLKKKFASLRGWMGGGLPSFGYGGQGGHGGYRPNICYDSTQCGPYSCCLSSPYGPRCGPLNMNTVHSCVYRQPMYPPGMIDSGKSWKPPHVMPHPPPVPSGYCPRQPQSTIGPYCRVDSDCPLHRKCCSVYGIKSGYDRKQVCVQPIYHLD